MAGKGSKPGERRGGRQKGTPNKTSASVKAALAQAFDEGGGVPALVKWMKDNRTEFYKIWSRLLPTEVKGNLDLTGRLAISELIVDADNPQDDPAA